MQSPLVLRTQTAATDSTASYPVLALSRFPCEPIYYFYFHELGKSVVNNASSAHRVGSSLQAAS